MTSRAIRSRKIGTNQASDRYGVLFTVSTVFRDLALFVIHTGFANIRRYPAPNQYAFTSLEIAWRLVNQGFLPAFVLSCHCFTIAPTPDMGRLLGLQCVLPSPFDTSFRPESRLVSVDALLVTILRAYPATRVRHVRRAIFLVCPEFRISRTTVAYRMNKVVAGHISDLVCDPSSRSLLSSLPVSVR